MKERISRFDHLDREELVLKLEALETELAPYAEIEVERARLEAEERALRQKRDAALAEAARPAATEKPQPTFLSRFKGLFGGSATPPEPASAEADSGQIEQRLADVRARIASVQEKRDLSGARAELEALVLLCRAKIDHIDQIAAATVLRDHHIAIAEHHQNRQYAELGLEAARACLRAADEMVDLAEREAANPLPDPIRFERENRLIAVNLAGHHLHVQQIADRLGIDTQLPADLKLEDEAPGGDAVTAMIEGGAASAAADPLTAVRRRYPVIIEAFTAAGNHHAEAAKQRQAVVDQFESR
ncbi:hypothetical protein [Acanthopleuribacter pedis]|uniref:Uncharacterized protein n=1 Tax=Acanthopleuribacter pedis TaxID=442870 RepID=A0A8J7U441_9BACT|nr:hypothetical protein [Acanthopleuribacter pedis]MBO1321093.1 hypothetical protein [Acanthopleuribacter pedis]